MKLRFTKMQGTGNDFMVIDAIRQTVPELTADQVRRLADRHFGVGFDQLLLVERALVPGTDFNYRIFNADGTEVQMCGNGARCFARFVLEHGLTDRERLRVSTARGVIELMMHQDQSVTVNMGPPVLEPRLIPLRSEVQRTLYGLDLEDGGYIEFGAVSMGNPHAVLNCRVLSDEYVATVAPLVQASPAFPEGVNVGFMQIRSPEEISLRVFERGCGETLACGSGACAAVVCGVEQHLLSSLVTVHLPGGELRIIYAGGGSDVLLTGPAHSVYDGEIELHE